MSSHKEFLNKHKLSMLQRAAQKVIDSDNTVIDIKMFRDSINDHNNWQKCRYHGLIAHAGTTRGKWIITRNGWAFLRGELSLPKWVLIEDNHIIARSDELTGVRSLYHNPNTIISQFQYYDDNGHYIGIRPLAPENRQVSLL